MESPATATALLLLLSTAKAFATVAETTICNMTEDGLQPCKPSATPPNPPPPSAACCEALAGADLPYLCSHKDAPALRALGIDRALAVQLPAKCNLAAPANC